MNGRYRWGILTALLIAVGATLPSPVAASDDLACTEAYEKCLNDSYDKKGFAEYLANLECGARFARCIMDIIIPA